MYLDFFDIKEPPFSITPDPRYLYPSVRHQEALAHLLYALTGSGGFALLSGEVGAGKTTLCRHFLGTLPPDVDVALIVNPRLDERELMATILDELSIPHPSSPLTLKAAFDTLNTYLLDAHAKGRRTVLIIDEAQNLSPSLLELIRLLTNLETAKTKLLQIILIGQPEIEELLARPDLRQLAQRITARYALKALNREETRAYVRYRLGIAGLAERTFSEGALTEIYRYGRGIPRLINVVCDRALLGAYARGRKTVNGAIARKAVAEVRGVSAPRRSLRKYLFATLSAAVIVLALGWAGLSSPQERTAAWARIETFLKRETPLHETRSPHTPVDNFTQGKTQPSTPTPQTPTSMKAASPILAPNAPNTPNAPDLPPDLPTVPGNAHGSSSSAFSASTVPDTTLRTPPERPPAPAPRGSAGKGASQVPAPLTLQGAYDALFRLWGAEYPRLKGFSPCEKAATVGLSCLRGQGGLKALEDIALPALVRLKAEPLGKSATSPGAAYAVIDTLRPEKISFSDGTSLPRTAFATLWDGNYLLLWPSPKGIRPILRQGMHGKDIAWLRDSLERISPTFPHPSPGTAAKDTVFDANLVLRVQDFQRAHGLPADGIAGPQTLARLGRLLGWPDAPMSPPIPRRTPSENPLSSTAGHG